MNPRTITRLAQAASFAIATLCLAPTARAQSEDDGIYGRFEGDLDLRFGAGASVTREGPGLAAFASALLVSSAGVYVHYTDAFDHRRTIATGVVIEPLFLARMALDLEHLGPRLDLTVDSFAIGLGTFWALPSSPLHPNNAPGLEFSLGFGIPLFAQATGPVLGARGALRVSPAALAGAENVGLWEQGATVSITLAWRHVVHANLVDPRDRAVR